jgi:hypothetical protein
MISSDRIATVAVFCLVRCAAAGAADDRATAAFAARYFPLQPGLRWVYQVDDHYENTAEKVEVSVLGRRQVPGVPHDVVLVDEQRSSAAGPTDTVPVLYYAERDFVTMRNDFAYRMGSLVVSLAGYTPRRILPLTPTPGQSWQETTYTSGETSDRDDNPTRCEWTYRVLGHETVNVPAGRFADAVRVETTARHRFFTYVYDDWYAADVGLVQSLARNPAKSDEVLVRLQLLSFDGGEKAPKQSETDER